jgi:hypothetical protein
MEGDEADGKVALMGRIEGTAEQADPHTSGEWRQTQVGRADVIDSRPPADHADCRGRRLKA